MNGSTVSVKQSSLMWDGEISSVNGQCWSAVLYTCSTQ